MEQKDYLLRQFEMLGRVLGNLITMLLGIKQPDYAMAYHSVSQVFQTELELDLDALLAIPDEEFITSLKTEHSFNNENLAKLAEMLSLLGKHAENQPYLYEKSLLIYVYLEQAERVFDFERQEKIAAIKELLNNHTKS